MTLPGLGCALGPGGGTRGARQDTVWEMKDSAPQTLTYVSVFLLVIMMVAGLWEARRRSKLRRTEAQLVQQLREQSEAPELATGQDEFPQDRWHPQLHSQLGRIAARLQEGIGDCLDGWQTPPGLARVRVTTDPAGRLTTLAVQGAPETVELCLARVLKRGQYPRKVDGVAELPLVYR